MKPIAQASLMRLSMGRPGTQKGKAGAVDVLAAEGKKLLGAA